MALAGGDVVVVVVQIQQGNKTLEKDANVENTARKSTSFASGLRLGGCLKTE